MHNQNTTRRIKIAVLLFIAACACWNVTSRQTSASIAGEPQRRFEIVGIDAPFGERAGTDDGAAFVLHFFGNTHGSLEPCG